jgi:hypothetical protein
MKLRTLVIAISTVAGLSLAPVAFSQTCSTGQWGQGGNPTVGATIGSPVAGGPRGAAIARYQGRCALSGGTAVAGGRYVQDSSPAGEPTFRARFYFYSSATGSTVIYRAGNAAASLTDMNTGQIRVVQNGTTLTVSGPTGSGTAFSTPVVANRWYAVELGYNNTAGVLGTGAGAVPASTMSVSVRGNAVNAPVTGSVTLPAPSVANNIDFAQLGNLSGTGGVITDSYESRRTTPIGFLCRGDANSDNNRNILDIVAIANENNSTTATSLAAGQPDANEDGFINILDIVAVAGIANSVSPACPAP